MASEPHRLHFANTKAELAEIADFAGRLPERFLLCREIGHNWRPATADVSDDGHYVRVLRCTRCSALRHQHIDRRGVIVSTRYELPEGYQREPGAGRLVGAARGVLRLESITRIMQKEERRGA